VVEGQHLSASRLNEFLGCAHRAALRLEGIEPSDEANAGQRLVRQKGFEHEAAVLSRLEQELSHKAVKIPARDEGSLESSLELTRRAIADGAHLIYQAALATDNWVGYPDFLVRRASLYELEDAKLARNAKPEHVLQLGVYARLLRETVGISVTHGAIHVSGGPRQRFDLRRTNFVTNRMMAKFEYFAGTSARQTRPLKCAACARCEYKSRCEREWRRADSPIFVSGLRVEQLLKLERSGIATMSQLAQLKEGTAVAELGADTLIKLRNQARLQASAGLERKYEILPIESGRGFTLLPPPDPADIFLDLEGDPLFPEGLEYLFGWIERGKGGEPTFHDVWAHDHDAERIAFETALNFLVERMRANPQAHIFHFGHYEEAAFKRLAMKYATREDELDELLRAGRFINLYRIIRQALRLSTESMSLKVIEGFYWNGRSGEVATGQDSIVAYERWRIESDQSILTEIARYNSGDCISILKLSDWLQTLRPAGAAFGLEDKKEALGTGETRQQREAREEQKRALAARVRASSSSDRRVCDLVAELLWFHQRSQKPRWWAIFDRKTWTDDELVEDPESLGGLQRDRGVAQQAVKRSLQVRYEFAPQDTKLKVGSKPRIAIDAVPAGTIQELDPDQGFVVLKRDRKFGDYPIVCSLSPEGPIKVQVLADALAQFASRFADGKLDSDRAAIDYLERKPPRVKGLKLGEPLVDENENVRTAAIRAICNLDESALFIQGPPGTGKTETASHAILALLRQGRRVAVSSNSHKAINNLLDKIEARAREGHFSFVGAKKGSEDDEESLFNGQFIKTIFDSSHVNETHRVVGGTAFHFAKESLNVYDYLFVDEAGQVSVGNLLAMAGCAKNLVLVGDQMQLSQPIQGVHPGESGLSCLDYLLEDNATVPPGQGILLNISYRMHPSICALVSDAIYDGRLGPDPSNAQRVLALKENAHPALRSAGISFLTLEHSGCSQSSMEEVEAIEAVVDDLVRHNLVLPDGFRRRLELGDILVVAPYNMQVNRLKRALPKDCKVGTVDKFQGLQAPVVIVSMTTSCGNEAPRGTEFLFSRNRFNVAVSRAETLAVVVQSSKLQDVDVSTIDDLVRLNLFAHAEQTAMEPIANSA